MWVCNLCFGYNLIFTRKIIHCGYNNDYLRTLQCYVHKVQLFWEGHKNLLNLPCLMVLTFNVKTMRQSAQIFVAFSEKLNFTYVCSKCKRIRNMLAWDWLYEWMIKQAAQAGFCMTSSPIITGFFYHSDNIFVKWSEETIENEYIFP